MSMIWFEGVTDAVERPHRGGCECDCGLGCTCGHADDDFSVAWPACYSRPGYVDGADLHRRVVRAQLCAEASIQSFGPSAEKSDATDRDVGIEFSADPNDPEPT
jgi:hypothetical protein